MERGSWFSALGSWTLDRIAVETKLRCVAAGFTTSKGTLSAARHLLRGKPLEPMVRGTTLPSPLRVRRRHDFDEAAGDAPVGNGATRGRFVDRCRPSCPRHHHPAGLGDGNQPDAPRPSPRTADCERLRYAHDRDPDPIEKKQPDRFACYIERRRNQTRTRWLRSLIRPVFGAYTTRSAAQGDNDCRAASFRIRTHSQKTTRAASAITERKTFGHLP